jgi:HEAT repeat protein
METAREAATRVFGKIGPAASDAVPLLIAGLADKDQRVRLVAACTLGQIGPHARAALPVLVPSLVDTHEAMRKAAAEALAKIDPNWASEPGIQRIIETFAENLKRSGESGQVAMEAFVLIGSASIPTLVKVLSATDRVQREAAAVTLGRIGTAAQAAIPALVKALQDSHGWVREAARQALEKVDPQSLCSVSQGTHVAEGGAG